MRLTFIAHLAWTHRLVTDPNCDISQYSPFPQNTTLPFYWLLLEKSVRKSVATFSGKQWYDLMCPTGISHFDTELLWERAISFTRNRSN